MKMVKFYIASAIAALFTTYFAPYTLLKLLFGWTASSLIAVSSAYLLNFTSLVVANAAPLTTALAQGSAPPDVTDGRLDLTWLNPQTSSDRQFLSLAELVLSLNDAKQHSNAIKHAQARSIRLAFDSPTLYAVDGEIFKDSKIEITT